MSQSIKVDNKNYPPIPEHRKSVYEYYKLTFDEAGCPMKTTESGMVFHPILAAYLIVEYVTWFKKTKDIIYIGHAVKIANLALCKCEYRDGIAIFLYRQSEGLSYVPGDYYSALTQAWYIKALTILRPLSMKYFGCGYDKEVKAIYKSLVLPFEEGGVLIRKEWGWLVEEYPHSPPLYTLNGWLTVLRIIKDSRLFLSEIGIDVVNFLDNNCRALETILPYYDAEFVHNSRYQLTGFSRVRIVFDRTVNLKIEAFAIDIPGEGRFQGALQPSKSRWRNYLEREEQRLLQFNVVLSLISSPSPNQFIAQFTIDKACKAEMYIADGDYSPDFTAMPTKRWRHIKTFNLDAGDVSIEENLPFDERNMFAYPTNFKKVIGGKNFNAYHFIHIIDLAELYSYSGRLPFKQYALRWLKFVEAWPKLDALKDHKYSLEAHAYGNEFPSLVAKALARSERVIPFPMEM
jgi:D-glucuronyl C5-epimerase C-terminus